MSTFEYYYTLTNKIKMHAKFSSAKHFDHTQFLHFYFLFLKDKKNYAGRRQNSESEEKEKEVN